MRRLSSFLSLLCLLAPLTPAASTAAGAWVDPRVASHGGRTSAFIHVRPGASLARSVRAMARLGLDTGTVYPELDAFLAYGDPELFARAATQGSVEAIEANSRIRFLTDSSHVATRGQDLLDGAIAAPDGSVIDGRGVGVAIVDSGIEGTHPDLESRVVSNVKIVCPSHPTSVYVQPITRPEECIHPAAKVAVPMEDTDTPSAGGHGTHVAGIVAGTGAVSQGRWHGAAPGASLYGVSIGTAVTVENAVDGLRWVLDNHDQVTPAIRVVNNSWGTATHSRYSTAPDHFHSVAWKMQEALVAAGVTVVQAAGNTGGDGSAATTTPECVNPTPGIICVANYYDHDDGRRSGNIDGSSSRGNADPAFVDTWPDVSAPGTNIISTCREALPVCSALGGMVEEPADAYASMTGTSMAAPHVTGVVAQITQVDPSLTPARIEQLLEDSAYKFTWGERYSFTDPDNPDDATSFEKGHGLVDGVAAVTQLLDPESVPEPDPEWPSEPPPPDRGDPGPPQRFFFHSTARVQRLDREAGTNAFSSDAPALGGGALASEEWFNASGPDPSWTGSVEGPLHSLQVDFWVKSSDESTHDVGVPPLFHVHLQVGDDLYRLPTFAAKTSQIDSVPRRITRVFTHYLVPDGPDEGTAEDLAYLDVDTSGKPVTISIGADWFHHAGAIVFDSSNYPSGFSANMVPAQGCSGGSAGSASPAKLYLRSSSRNGNLDAAIGQTALDPSAPAASEDARIEDLIVVRNPSPAAALDPIWRGGPLDGTICSLTVDVWQKQTLDEAILQQAHYYVTLWVGDRAYRLPPLVAAGSPSDATRVTHTFATMIDDFGTEVPLLIDATTGPIAFEIAGQYVDADVQTSVFYDSVARPSSISINT